MASSENNSAELDLRAIETSLSQIARCLGVLVTKSSAFSDAKNVELIPILSSIGFDRNDIASILRTTPGTVSVALSRLKSKTTSKDNNRAVTGGDG